MHIPGHFTPFSQSLMNRGMKQTNNNIGNINNPNENIMGGGMQPGGPIFQETGISTGFGDSEMGSIIPVPPCYETEENRGQMATNDHVLQEILLTFYHLP